MSADASANQRKTVVEGATVPQCCYIAPVLKNAIIRLSANSIEYQMVNVKLSAIYPSIIRHFYLLRR